ncbi:MAG: hypothetical protein O7B35_03965 [Deltaproteobacteria bacterium]|nr:hypothetical protein [Deltaproteobacteria bacterium]
MKRWLLIGGGLIVLIIVVVFFLFSKLDSLIIAAVEKYGSEITQTKVQLNEVDISLTSGEGALRGLTMGNPKGFKTDSAFRLGEISIKLDVSTVTQNPVVIKEIVISAPQVTYELGPKGSNIDAIKRNVDAYMGKMRNKTRDKSTSKGSDKEGRNLVIEHLYIRDGKVDISSTVLQGKTLSAPLPDIHLTDIGKKKGGATPGEVAEKVLGALRQAVGKAVASVGPGKLLGTAKEGVAAAKGAIEESAKGAADSLKKLFGN